MKLFQDFVPFSERIFKFFKLWEERRIERKEFLLITCLISTIILYFIVYPLMLLLLLKSNLIINKIGKRIAEHENTKNVFKEISTRERNFTALSNRAVALKTTRISSYVTSNALDDIEARELLGAN